MRKEANILKRNRKIFTGNSLTARKIIFIQISQLIINQISAIFISVLFKERTILGRDALQTDFSRFASRPYCKSQLSRMFLCLATLYPSHDSSVFPDACFSAANSILRQIRSFYPTEELKELRIDEGTPNMARK